MKNAILSLALWGFTMTYLHLGSDGNSLALRVDGETIIERTGLPPTGHPGTPLGVRRKGMLPDRVATVINLAAQTDGIPGEGFGPMIGFIGTDWDGQDAWQSYLGSRWKEPPSPTNRKSQIFLYGLTGPRGDATPRVWITVDDDGLAVYTTDSQWFDSSHGFNPIRPAVRLGSDGSIYAKKIITQKQECEACQCGSQTNKNQ